MLNLRLTVYIFSLTICGCWVFSHVRRFLFLYVFLISVLSAVLTNHKCGRQMSLNIIYNHASYFIFHKNFEIYYRNLRVYNVEKYLYTDIVRSMRISASFSENPKSLKVLPANSGKQTLSAPSKQISTCAFRKKGHPQSSSNLHRLQN